MNLNVLNFLIILNFLSLVTCQNPSPIVTTANGIILGSWRQSTNGRQYASFQGVPYAQPPVGKYRFKEPQPLERWIGVWNASSPLSRCIQYDPFATTITGSESCLYLNIATPNPCIDASLPVLVYIHGGAFMYGEGDIYSPSHLMDRSMVVVTINYRLGPMGFLSTGDQAAPGNYGLKDQAFALHWVKNNIIKFGGNPNSVTLTGTSAGGASVHYHYLSPLSKDTFHRGIAFSGSALASWAYATQPLQNAKALGAFVGCPTEDNAIMVECLRNRPAEVVVNAQTELFDWRVNLFTPFTPTTEPMGAKEAFLTKYPFYAMQAGSAARLPLITTVTSEEGLYPAAVYQSDPTILPELEARWGELANYIFVYNDTLPVNRRPEVAARIKQKYLNGKAISQETYSQLVQALGDRLFVVSVGKLAQLHAVMSGEPTYVYRYAYRSNISLSNFLARNNNNYGVSHADDLQLILKYLPTEGTSPTPEDVKMSNVLIDMIYAYASTGVPTLPNNTQWVPVQPGSTELNYLNIAGPDNLEMKENCDFGNRSFWDSLGFIENERYQQSYN